MIFPDLPAGTAVFLDADVLVYHFTADPQFGPACRDLLERIENQELSGFTSAQVVAEVSHRVMTLETIAAFGWSYQGIAARLRKHHAEIPKLDAFRQAVAKVPQLGVHVFPLTQQLVEAANLNSQKYELLTNDALIVAVMQANGLTHLASNDADFDRVPGLRRYAPV